MPLIHPMGGGGGRVVGYSLFGPTCDSADTMRGPFHLPADVREGDWIEIGQLGPMAAACVRVQRLRPCPSGGSARRSDGAGAKLWSDGSRLGRLIWAPGERVRASGWCPL